MSFDPKERRGPIGQEADRRSGFSPFHRLDNWLEAVIGGSLAKVHREQHLELKKHHPAKPELRTSSDSIENFFLGIQHEVELGVHGLIDLLLDIVKWMVGFPWFVSLLIFLLALGVPVFLLHGGGYLWFPLLGAGLLFGLASASLGHRAFKERKEQPLQLEGMIRFVRVVWLAASGALVLAGHPIFGLLYLLESLAFYLMTEAHSPLRLLNPSPPREPNGMVRLFGRKSAEGESGPPRRPLFRRVVPWRRGSPVGEE